MKSIKLYLISLFSITLLIGCSTRSYLINMSPLPIINNQFIPSIIWHQSVGDSNKKYYSQLSPVYDNFIVYAANRKGVIQAMDITCGKIFWSIDLSKYIDFFTPNLSSLLASGLTISKNKIYIGTETGKVIALNKVDGSIIWKTDVTAEVLSKPVVSNGLVLIHTSDDILQALDEYTGHNKWSIHLSTIPRILSIRGNSTPSITHGIAIIGSDNGSINAIILSQRQIIWRRYISQICGINEINRLYDVDIMPVIDTNLGIIFAVAYNGNLVAIDMYSSEIIWKRNLGSVNDIIVVNNILYLVDKNDRVLAIRKNDGITLWTQDSLLYHNLTAPIIYNGYLIIGDSNGYLYWLDSNNGKFIAQNKIDSSGFHSKPVIAKDKLLIQANNGIVYLIKH
ncbi:MAG: outer membrane protein assembly factor BamB [Arsenophonus endosymbiont of Ceratovacuna japonica]